MHDMNLLAKVVQYARSHAVIAKRNADFRIWYDFFEKAQSQTALARLCTNP